MRVLVSARFRAVRRVGVDPRREKVRVRANGQPGRQPEMSMVAEGLPLVGCEHLSWLRILYRLLVLEIIRLWGSWEVHVIVKRVFA